MGKLSIFENSHSMLWWKKCEDAARYIFHLYVGEMTNWIIFSNGGNIEPEYSFYEISRIEKDRHTCYHTFKDLHQVCCHGIQRSGVYQMSYYIEVEAESHDGEIIASSGKRPFATKFDF